MEILSLNRVTLINGVEIECIKIYVCIVLYFSALMYESINCFALKSHFCCRFWTIVLVNEDSHQRKRIKHIPFHSRDSLFTLSLPRAILIVDFT